jgi:hypothetical protein
MRVSADIQVKKKGLREGFGLHSSPKMEFTARLVYYTDPRCDGRDGPKKLEGASVVCCVW